MIGKGRGSRLGQGEPGSEMQMKPWATHWGTPEQRFSREEFPLGRNVQALTTPHSAVSHGQGVGGCREGHALA